MQKSSQTPSQAPAQKPTQKPGNHNIDPTADIHPSVILEGKAPVGAYTKIDAGTIIMGNVTIGHHTVIRCNVTIRGTNQIGNYTHVYDNVCIEGGRPAKVGGSRAETPDRSEALWFTRLRNRRWHLN
jgi:UDP-3-O-[3-hydroxymyristoyl] glucosamine N-acyltransferase